MNILKYSPAYREKCIAIFDSNMPKFFAVEEKELFKAFLDHDIDNNYYVVEKDGEVVACGGVFLDNINDEGGLSWGMVRADQHKNGIGKALTDYRIGLLKKKYPDKTYKVDTSQHTASFYVKRGFKTMEVIKDGFAKGLDKYVMKMGG